jgi:hypothetical protein
MAEVIRAVLRGGGDSNAASLPDTMAFVHYLFRQGSVTASLFCHYLRILIIVNAENY